MIFGLMPSSTSNYLSPAIGVESAFARSRPTSHTFSGHKGGVRRVRILSGLARFVSRRFSFGSGAAPCAFIVAASSHPSRSAAPCSPGPTVPRRPRRSPAPDAARRLPGPRQGVPLGSPCFFGSSTEFVGRNQRIFGAVAGVGAELCDASRGDADTRSPSRPLIQPTESAWNPVPRRSLSSNSLVPYTRRAKFSPASPPRICHRSPGARHPDSDFRCRAPLFIGKRDSSIDLLVQNVGQILRLTAACRLDRQLLPAEPHFGAVEHLACFFMNALSSPFVPSSRFCKSAERLYSASATAS